MKSFWILAVALSLASAVALGQTAGAPAPGAPPAAPGQGAASTGSFDSAAQPDGDPAPSPEAPGSAAPGAPGAPAPSGASGTPASPAGVAPAASRAPAEQPGATGVAAQAAPGSTPVAIDGSTYKVRLRDLEARVDELKEQIRRSHTRLSLLSETILAGGIGGARAEIVLVNELSGAFKIVRALVVVDGAVQYNQEDTDGTLSEQGEIPVYTGSIPPGDHTVQVRIELKGHGYGVFSYLKGYETTQNSSHAFTVTDGKTAQIKIVVWEKGGVTTPVQDRPAIRYVEKIKSGNRPRSTDREGGR